MKGTAKILLAAVLAIFLWTTSSFAANITIYDNRSGTSGGSTGDGWWTRTTEDQEVEPGMVNAQVWDLEGFFLSGNNLSIVAGWNFLSGAPGYSFASGDIFIDTTGDAWYGKDGTPPMNYGYEYVLDVNWSAGTYKAYALDGSSQLVQVSEWYNQIESNPWRLNYTDEVQVSSGSFTFEQGLSDAGVGFLGGSHYRVSGFDLGFVPAGTQFIAHFTMECGNDNLVGQGTAVPEPATMFLFGTGLIGLAGVGRRKFLRK